MLVFAVYAHKLPHSSGYPALPFFLLGTLLYCRQELAAFPGRKPEAGSRLYAVAGRDHRVLRPRARRLYAVYGRDESWPALVATYSAVVHPA